MSQEEQQQERVANAISAPSTRSSLFGGCTDQRVLGTEEAIVWLRDPADYPYLRETTYTVKGRRSKVTDTYLTIVGYATLRPNARDSMGQPARPGAFFTRRVWYVSSHNDPYEAKGTVGWPIEAVWPSSVKVGLLSAGPTDEEHYRAGPNGHDQDSVRA